MTDLSCPNCSEPLIDGLKKWHSYCRVCGYESASLLPIINESSVHESIDEAARAQGLRAIRIANFEKLLSELHSFKKNGKLLDVGCAHGWFLAVAAKSYKVVGVEPDRNIAILAKKDGHEIRVGYFPDVLVESEKFDVIIFNDVIEHIQDIRSTLESCRRHLNATGVLVLNLPSSNGIFYRLSKALSRLGLSSFFDRMWQVGLPSPHVHYFNPANLLNLLESCQFTVSKVGYLDSLRSAGLYTRISYAKSDRNVLFRLALYTGVFLMLPLLRILPRDIFFVIAQVSTEKNPA